MMHRHRHQAAPPFALTIASSRRHLLQRLATLPAALGLGVLLAREPAVAKRKKRKGNGGGAYSPDKEERQFLDLINAYRKQNGAGALRLQDQLGAAAEHHSQDMAKKNYFKHTLANGDSAEENIERFGYRDWTRIGENIAAGYETADDVMAAWKKSRDHDRNMRDKDFTEIGIGRAYKQNAKYGWYWTTTFGRR